MKLPYFDNKMAELLTGGISTAIAILLTGILRMQIHKKYKILDHPLVDSIGIVIGTLIIIILYFIINYK